MKFISTPVNVTRLVSSLEEAAKTISEAFTIPLSEQECLTVLTACYKYEVAIHGGRYDDSGVQNTLLSQVARFLVHPAHRTGMIFMGQPGCGKTTMMLAVKLLVSRLKLHDDLAPSTETYAQATISEYDARDLLRYYDRSYEYFCQIKSKGMVAIDDLGEEQKGNVKYGQLSFPINEFIEYRYSRMLFTLITTNLPFDGFEDDDGNLVFGIRDVYGERFSDRLRESLLPVVFDRPSFRKRRNN